MKAERTQSFCRTLGLQTAFILLCRMFGHSVQETKKKAISKDWLIVVAAIILHGVPVVVAVGISVLNWKCYYIGGELAGKNDMDDLKFLGLLFAAKAHETLMMASLSACVFSIIRHQLTTGDGTPFGALSAGLQISSFSNIYSKEVVAICDAKFNQFRQKILLLRAILICTFLGVSVGPSSATALKPTYSI